MYMLWIIVYRLPDNFMSFRSCSVLQRGIYNAQTRFIFSIVAPLCAPGCLNVSPVTAHCSRCLHKNITQVPLWMCAGTVVGQVRLEYGTILIKMYRMLKENISLRRYSYAYSLWKFFFTKTYIWIYVCMICEHASYVRHQHAWCI